MSCPTTCSLNNSCCTLLGDIYSGISTNTRQCDVTCAHVENSAKYSRASTTSGFIFCNKDTNSRFNIRYTSNITGKSILWDTPTSLKSRVCCARLFESSQTNKLYWADTCSQIGLRCITSI